MPNALSRGCSRPPRGDAVPRRIGTALALQAKLLTAIETKLVRRLGLAERAVDVKLIAANAVLPGHGSGTVPGRPVSPAGGGGTNTATGEGTRTDLLVLAEAFAQHYSPHGVPCKPQRHRASMAARIHGPECAGARPCDGAVTLLHIGNMSTPRP
jgi:hypothetical protein